jgi:type IV pilus biogenesis protein CpaD/CtpE
MHKRLVSIVVITVLSAATQADPAPVRLAAHEGKADCGRELGCAEQFADALSSQPVAPQTLRLDSLITYAPGSNRVYSQSREKLQALAASWRAHARWSTITVVGHAGSGYHVALAQQRADRIRGYLVRYGVAAERVIAIAHDDAIGSMPGGARSARVDIAVEVCDRVAKDCARQVPIEVRTAARTAP